MEWIFVIVCLMGLGWTIWLAVYRPDLLKDWQDRKERAAVRRGKLVDKAADLAKFFISSRKK